MLGLFGWAHGGHDRLYPDNDPGPKMGGAEVWYQRMLKLGSEADDSQYHTYGFKSTPKEMIMSIDGEIMPVGSFLNFEKWSFRYV